MLEARCSLCGDTFVPADELDLEHFVRTSDDRHQGDACGGAGVIVGEWRSPTEAERRAYWRRLAELRAERAELEAGR